MTSHPSAENPSKDQAAAAPIEPDFSLQMHEFWAKNQRTVYAVCVAILLVIVGREGWQYYSAAHEQGLQEDFAKASSSPERLAQFAAAHSDHVLGAVAWLQLADAKYTANDFGAARDSYDKAAAALPNATLKARARLGAAMSRLAAGDAAGGESGLKAVQSDTSADKTIRAEAAYHLATLAQEAGRTEEARRLVEDVSKLDGAGLWAQRALALRASLPAETKSLLPPTK